MTDLFRAIRRTRGDVSQHAGPSLTLSQYHLLDALSDKGKLRVNEIAEAAEVSSPTATRMLTSLARKGIVRRVRAHGDGRAVEVTLTPEGRRLMDEKHARVYEKQRWVYERLQPHQREQAQTLLRQLTQLIDSL